MTIPDEPSNREIDLAALGSSDESVEELLSGGADIDALIAAGVLDVDEPASEDTEEGEEEAIDLSLITLTAEEAWAEFQQEQEWLIANGHKRPPVRI
jgi:short-subunit dehydrogenase